MSSHSLGKPEMANRPINYIPGFYLGWRTWAADTAGSPGDLDDDDIDDETLLIGSASRFGINNTAIIEVISPGATKATAILSFNGTPAEDGTITLVDNAGVSREYEFDKDGASGAPLKIEFRNGDTEADLLLRVTRAINGDLMPDAGQNLTLSNTVYFSAEIVGDTVVVSQLSTGPGGNRTNSLTASNTTLSNFTGGADNSWVTVELYVKEGTDYMFVGTQITSALHQQLVFTGLTARDHYTKVTGIPLSGLTINAGITQ